MQLIQRQPDLECSGGVGTYAATPKALLEHKPHLVTVDIRLGDGNGMDLLKFIKDEHPSVLTLVISQCDESLYAERALKAGARGYLMKERATEEVLSAIRTVLTGGLFVSPKIATLALNKMIGASPLDRKHNAIQTLTDRELYVLQLLGAGLSSRKTAAKLCLSVKTVESHRENIKRKLGIATAPELVRFATEWLNNQPPQTPKQNQNGGNV